MDYNLIIDSMTKVATSGSLSDVVTSVDYLISCTGSNEGTSSVYLMPEVDRLGTVESSSFVAYNDLTDGIVKSWVTGSLNWPKKLADTKAQMSASWFVQSEGLPW